MSRHGFILQELLHLLPLIVLSLCSLVPLASSLSNGLALTPPMGWSTWNVFECHYTETELRSVANSLVSSGLAAAGYRSFNIDDCWEAPQRTADGQLTYNTTKFPNGIKAFGDFLHSLNLTFGLYSSSGPATCQGYPGSEGHEAQDAKTLAGWGVDFLKLDSCYQFNVSARERSFTAMRDGLRAAGRPIVFSCSTSELITKSHNDEYPSEWGPSTCNMARVQWDISDSWQSTLELLRAAQNIAHASRPGYWNDLDILTVGQGGQTYDEYVSQFQAWSILNSPLILGLDVRSMSAEYRQVLLNPGAIRINQDRLGQAGNLVRRSVDGSYEVWAKALSTKSSESNSGGEEERALYRRRVDEARHRRGRSLLAATPPTGRYRIAAETSVTPFAADLPVSNFHPWTYHAVLLLNRASFAQNLTLDFYSDLFDNFMCPHAPPPTNATIVDAWSGKELGEFERTYTASNVPPHGSVLLTVRLVEQ